MTASWSAGGDVAVAADDDAVAVAVVAAGGVGCVGRDTPPRWARSAPSYYFGDQRRMQEEEVRPKLIVVVVDGALFAGLQTTSLPPLSL